MRTILYILLSFVLLSTTVHAQSLNNIKAQKSKSEKEIAYLNKLLKEAKSSKESSVKNLNLIQRKIEEINKLLNTLTAEVKYYERQIDINETKITELVEEKESLLSMYSKLIYELWKKRDEGNKLMFIFASDDFNQAYRRYKYFEQIQKYSKRQVKAIEQINDSLYAKNNELKKFFQLKNEALGEMNLQNKDLIQQKSNEDRLVKELQKKEKDLLAKIKKEQEDLRKLDKKINDLIAAQAKKEGKKTFELTPEQQLISDDFAKNKGKLPWPVAEGIISDKFGIKPHAIHKKVPVNNQGINISTVRDAEVRTVFKGEVHSIYLAPGYNNLIIISHGNYFTCYLNLVDVKVKVGQKVDTKEVIGRVGHHYELGNVLKFEIRANVKNSLKLAPQNPELWLSK